MSDSLISRQAAIDGVKTLHEVAWKNWHEPTLSANIVIDMIKDLPSVQPELNKGKWIKHERGYWTFVNKDGERDGWIPDYECSECGSRGWKYADNMNYCPQCGADMRGEEDG